MSSELQYVMMDPTGNMTLLVETPVDPSLHAKTASCLMDLEPEAEQTGFLSPSATCDFAMRMAGGEFCGNGAMSAAVLHAMKAGIDRGDVMIDFYGVDDPVCVRVSKDPETDAWRATVKMPDVRGIGETTFSNGMTLPVVRFDGICHVILDYDSMSEKEAAHAAKTWCRELQAEALGLMFLERNTSRLKPLVWVPDAETMCWENACGSGTSAVGAYLAETRNIRELSLSQPGGVLTVRLPDTGGIFLEGTVKFCYRRTVSFKR